MKFAAKLKKNVVGVWRIATGEWNPFMARPEPPTYMFAPDQGDQMAIVDVRHGNPTQSGDRKARFRQGWTDAWERDYLPGTLEHLTWQNLGYRLSKMLDIDGRRTPTEMQVEFYYLCVKQRTETSG